MIHIAHEIPRYLSLALSLSMSAAQQSLHPPKPHRMYQLGMYQPRQLAGFRAIIIKWNFIIERVQSPEDIRNALYLSLSQWWWWLCCLSNPVAHPGRQRHHSILLLISHTTTNERHHRTRVVILGMGWDEMGRDEPLSVCNLPQPGITSSAAAAGAMYEAGPSPRPQASP